MTALALYAYTAVYVARLHEIIEPAASIRLPLLLGVVCVVLTLAAPAARKREIFRQKEVRALLALVTVVLLSIPLSVWPAGSIDFVVNTYSRVLAFYFFVTILTATLAHARGVVWAFILGGGVLGAATAFELKSMAGAWQAEFGTRAYASATYDPNEVALMMVCLIPFTAYGCMFERRWSHRILLASVATVALLAVVKTMSRGGFIGLVGVLTLMLVRIWQSGRRQLALGVVAAAMGVALMLPGPYWQIMQTVLGGQEDAGYLGSGLTPRVEIWKEGLALFLRNPLTGAGFGQFEVGYGVARDGGKWSAAHNSFVQIGAEIGAVGLALFVWLLVTAFRNARRASREAPSRPALRDHRWMAAATEASLLGYVISGSTLSVAYSPVLYFLFALSLVLRLQAERPLAPPRIQTMVSAHAGR